MSKIQHEYIPIIFAAAYLANEWKNICEKETNIFESVINIGRSRSGADMFWSGFSLKKRIETDEEHKKRRSCVFEYGRELEEMIEQGRLEAKENPYCMYEVKVSSFINIVDSAYPYRKNGLNEWQNKISSIVLNGFTFANKTNATTTPEYLKPDHPRYAPKLAAAINAWVAVGNEEKMKGKTPKQALEKELRKTAAKFGLINEDGNPIQTAIEECSKVANWSPSGGAPKIPG